ncbi:MAG TPA: GntR family transcriptional regulator [Methylomirabilota bacterium]|nr:GntR family transcriptional regulator [Methylomirabilota bacterium]
MEARLGGRVPRYLRIADALRRRLAGGAAGRAARLPSESALAAEFQVSRETLREALALLRDEGLIYSLVGRGTFASPAHRPVGVRITQPINEPYVAGRPSVLKVLDHGLVPAPVETSRALGLPARSQVFCYHSLRTIRGRPFRYGRVYLSRGVAERLDLSRLPELTVSEKVEREAGIRLIRAHQVVVATAAPVEVARRFGVATGSPVLMFRRTYYQDSGRPVEFVLEYQDSARFPYEEALVRTTR